MYGNVGLLRIEILRTSWSQNITDEFENNNVFS